MVAYGYVRKSVMADDDPHAFARATSLPPWPVPFC